MRSAKKMMVLGFGVTLAICLVGLSTTSNAQILRWKQLNGIKVPGDTVGEGTGQVTGDSLPWSTATGWGEGGFARVNLTNGNLEFLVRGLALAGGDDIGTPGGLTQVKGTLVCNTHGPDSTLVDTALVLLSQRGLAFFIGNVGTLPTECLSSPDIAFLIRMPNGLWIANGSIRVVNPVP